MQRLHRALVLILLILVLIEVAYAVMGGSDEPPPRPGDVDYRAGVAAFERADWQGVIAHMEKAVTVRPWNDNAYNLMGFAYRKLGHYPRALAAYRQALDLNPHHRGALEYLGETYLVMGCVERANDVLGQLAAACKRVAENGGPDQGSVSCEEWTELKAAIDAVPPAAARACSLAP
jgi:tetratricopeptide (TPR) repeat protein